MKTVRLLEIEPYSAFKVGLGLGVFFGGLTAVLFAVVSIVKGIWERGFVGGVMGGVQGTFSGIFIGLMLVIGTGAACWLGALVYNITSRLFGPLEMDISG